MKRSYPVQWLVVVGIATVLVWATAAFGSKAGGAQQVTNVALLEKATSAAVDSLLREMPSSLEAQVYLRPAVAHNAAWMIENQLGGELGERGIEIVVSRASVTRAAPDSARADTTAVSDTLRTQVAATESSSQVMTLEYRITELGMQYPRVWRGHLIGQKKVERLAFVALHGRLIDETSGALLWVGEGSAMARDAVPASQLSFLEGEGENWQKGVLPAGKLGRVVEPLVVAAIVAGLVYLFYSNKE